MTVESGTPISLDTIVDRYVSTDTMMDNRTDPCKARYTYTVIHRYNRTGVQAKPDMHIVIHRYNRTGVYAKQLFTDTIKLVYM